MTGEYLGSLRTQDTHLLSGNKIITDAPPDNNGKGEAFKELGFETEANAAFAEQTGLNDATGKWMRDLEPAHEQHWFDLYGKVALTGQHVRFEQHAGQRGDRWYEVHAFRIGAPEAHQVAILFNDITTRRAADQQMKES